MIQDAISTISKDGSRARRHLICAALILAGYPALAQTPPPLSPPLAAAVAARFPQPVQVGALIGRTVLQPLESQPVLGHVAAVATSSDGTVIVVVNYGGWFGRFGGVFGIGARPIAVPVAAMTLLGPYMEIVGFTPQQLDRFPTFHDAGAVPLPPEDDIAVGLSKPSH